MRRFPISWDNTQSALGFRRNVKRVKQDRFKRKNGHFEKLEKREMLTADSLLGTETNRWTFDTDGLDEIRTVDIVDATVTGTIYGTNAKVGSGALQLDGIGDYANLSADQSNTVLEDSFSQYTVTAWFYADGTNPNTTQIIYEEGGASNGIALRLNGTKVEGKVTATGKTPLLASFDLGSNAYDQWHFAALTFDSGELKLHLNGSDLSQTAGDTNLSLTTVPQHTGVASIGKQSVASPFGQFDGSFFKGSIDDVRVFDGKALNSEEINFLASDTYVVTTLADQFDGEVSDGLSLREAIAFAKLTGGQDTITFSDSLFPAGSAQETLFLGDVNGINGLEPGEMPSQLFIDSDISIIGPGSDQLTISGANETRVLQLATNLELDVSLSGLTIANGFIGSQYDYQNITADARGGGIYSVGNDLTLEDVTLKNNYALLPKASGFAGNSGSYRGYGGAIYFAGINGSGEYSDLTISNSTIDSNYSGFGGGINIEANYATVEIDSSTLSNNQAVQGLSFPVPMEDPDVDIRTASTSSAYGGGLRISSSNSSSSANKGSVKISNSTIAGNVAVRDGGAISANGLRADLIIENSTISGNEGYQVGGIKAARLGVQIVNSTITENYSVRTASQGYGGGIDNNTNNPAYITLHNTIVAGNTKYMAPANDLRGAIESVSSGNIIDAWTNDNESMLTGINQLISNSPSTDASDIDLLPLSDYGGPTQTHALGPNSIAIDQGDDTEGTPTDQREFDRYDTQIGDNIIDVGAYETSPNIILSSFQVSGTEVLNPLPYLDSDGELLLTYDVMKYEYDSLYVTLYRSSDGINKDAAITSPISINESSKLAVGNNHEFSFTPAFNSTSDIPEDYRLIAEISGIYATNNSPTTEPENSSVFDGGIFIDSNNNVHINGNAFSNSIYNFDLENPTLSSANHIAFFDFANYLTNQITIPLDASVFIRSGKGDDTIQIPLITFETTIYSGEGNDTIITGNDINYVYPGDGMDKVTINASEDVVIYDGIGDDEYIVESTHTGDTLYFFSDPAGAGGLDSLNFSSFTNDLSINITPGISSPLWTSGTELFFSAEIIEDVYGGNGNDIFTGNSLDNTFTGKGGNDTFTGGNSIDLFTDADTGDTPSLAGSLISTSLTGASLISLQLDDGGDSRDWYINWGDGSDNELFNHNETPSYDYQTSGDQTITLYRASTGSTLIDADLVQIETITVTTLSDTPVAPRGIELKGVGNGEYRISWQQDTIDADYVEIEFSTNGIDGWRGDPEKSQDPYRALPYNLTDNTTDPPYNFHTGVGEDFEPEDQKFKGQLFGPGNDETNDTRGRERLFTKTYMRMRTVKQGYDSSDWVVISSTGTNATITDVSPSNGAFLAEEKSLSLTARIASDGFGNNNVEILLPNEYDLQDNNQLVTYEIEKRLANSSQTWTLATGVLQSYSPSSTTISWIDNDIILSGQIYEYKIIRNDNRDPIRSAFTFHKDTDGNGSFDKTYSVTENLPEATGYIEVANEVSISHQIDRGEVFVVVDSQLRPQLNYEIERFVSDLTGDGWQVVIQDVDPSRIEGKTVDSIVEASIIKGLITDIYNDSSYDLKSVILLGDLPVVNSGLNLAPDGHRWRPLETDLYYADLEFPLGNGDGPWVDEKKLEFDFQVQGGNAIFTIENGSDGHFDVNSFNTTGLDANFQDVVIGRIDMSNLSTDNYGSHIDNMRAYLDRDHAYRHGNLDVNNQVMIYDGGPRGELSRAAAISNYGPLVGNDGFVSNARGPNVSHNSWPANWANAHNSVSENFLYGHIGSTGVNVGGKLSNTHLSDDINNDIAVRTIFNEFTSSYSMEWNSTRTDYNNAYIDTSNMIMHENHVDTPMNAVLAANGFGLTSFWSDSDDLHLQSLAIGDTIGEAILKTQNEGSMYGNDNIVEVYRTLMGDPTLRTAVLASPTHAELNSMTGTITWGASPDPNTSGYVIFSDDGTGNGFQQLTMNGQPVEFDDNTFSHIDVNYSTGTEYMVRAKELHEEYSGSYYNLSQGVFTSGYTYYDAGADPGEEEQNGGLQLVKAINYGNVLTIPGGQAFSSEASDPNLNSSSVTTAVGLYPVSDVFTKAKSQAIISDSINVSSYAIDTNFALKLYFAEIDDDIDAADERLFDIIVEGTTVIEDYDIFADLGSDRGSYIVINLDFPIDGSIDFSLDGEGDDDALLSAFELYAIE